jgi:hypothetical protein
MSFFVTSTGSGMMGGNLGGLDGADMKCQMLAMAVGAGNRMWRAYLSTSMVNARDRIGRGPWFNARGQMIAANLEQLHPTVSATNMRDAYIMQRPNPMYMLDERGMTVPQREHDILTGSQPNGMVAGNTHCMNWTSNAAGGGGPTVGHTDVPAMFSASWNAAHTAPGCSTAQLVQVGGAGRLYCFAAD